MEVVRNGGRVGIFMSEVIMFFGLSRYYLNVYGMVCMF